MIHKQRGATDRRLPSFYMLTLEKPLTLLQGMGRLFLCFITISANFIAESEACKAQA